MKIRKGYVDTEEGQVHYREAGSGLPLVLLHQSPSSSAMWEPILPLLADEGFQTVAFDMPGFGASFKPSSAPSVADYARSLAEAASLMGLKQYDLFGHHTGAGVAIQMTADQPRTVRKLALWGVPVLKPDFRERLANEQPPKYGEDGEEILAFWRRRWTMGKSGFYPERSLRWLIEMLQTGFERPWGHRAAAGTDYVPLLKQITQPVLTLAGEYDQLWQETQEATKLLSNGRYQNIANASLDVADEFPEQLVSALVSFLREP